MKQQNVASSNSALCCAEFSTVVREVSKMCRPFDYITSAERRRLYGRPRKLSQKVISYFRERLEADEIRDK